MSKKRSIPVARTSAVIYIRVSTQEQVENLSLTTQEARCRALCQKEGWPVIRVFREEGQSAKTTRREQFQLMLFFAKDPKNGVGHIVVHDLSRFARNMLDQISTEHELKKAEVRLESVMEPTEDSADGRFLRNFHAAYNQYDNEKRAERTVVGMTQAAKIGRFPFKAPLGYINVSQHRGHNLIPDPKTAPLIAKAFELFATGAYSKAEVLKKVNALGLTTRKGEPMTMQTFQRLLDNPVYAGWVSIKKWGVRSQGSFEPLITQHVFDLVQDVLAGRRVVAKAYDHNNPDFPLRVFVRCRTCLAPLTGGWSTGKKKKYAYYRFVKCECNVGNIGRDQLESKFVQLLRQRTPDPATLTDFLNAIRSEWKRRQGDADLAYASVQRRLSKARERKNRLVDLRLDGEIGQDEYKEQSDRLEQEIDAASTELRQAESEFLDLEGVLTFAEKISSSPARLWLESSIDQQRRLQELFFPEGVTYDGETFRTPSSSSLFEVLGCVSGGESRLASPTGFEPVLSP